jgi:membrane protein
MTATLSRCLRARRVYNDPMAHTAWVLLKRFFQDYSQTNCSQLAAAISYFVIFSIIPLAIFVVSILTMVLGERAQAEIIDAILGAFPLEETEGREALQNAFDSARAVSGPVAVVALLATLWTASTAFGAIRRALNMIWHVPGERVKLHPFVQGKMIDFLQVGVLMFNLLASLVLTGFLRTVREISAEQFGPLANSNVLWEVPPIVLPALISFITFAVLYRVVPATPPAWRDAVTGALLAMVLFELLKNSFALYVANFNNFDVVYGSLTGALLFLLYMYLAANILLVGGLVARMSELNRAGAYEGLIHPAGPEVPLKEQALRAVKGLFSRQP